MPTTPHNPPPAPPKERQTLDVLHVINGEHYSGAERVQDLLAARLPEFNYQVTFVCVKPKHFPHQRQWLDAPLAEMPMRSRFDLRSAWRIARRVREGGFRLIHAHTPRSLLVGNLAAKLSGVPLVYHVHSPTSRDSKRPIRNFLNARSEAWCLRGTSRVITVSESLKRHIIAEGVPSEKVRVAPNGVPPLTEPVERHLPQGTWRLGTVALFRPRKGTEVLLEALAQLRDEGLPVRLRAVGPFEAADYERHIRGLADRLELNDLIEWVGFTSDVNAQLREMDLFVLPSLFGEGMPMVVLEAMAAGLPIVGTRVEGVPEVIRDGKDGLLAEPGDAASLATVLGRIIRGQCDWLAMSESARIRQAESFSDRSMAAAIARVYDEILRP